MTCFTDTFCSELGLFDLVFAATAAIDYVGTILLGNRWESLSPEIGARAESIQYLISDFFGRPVEGCQLYAGREMSHG